MHMFTAAKNAHVLLIGMRLHVLRLLMHRCVCRNYKTHVELVIDAGTPNINCVSGARACTHTTHNTNTHTHTLS